MTSELEDWEAWFQERMNCQGKVDVNGVLSPCERPVEFEWEAHCYGHHKTMFWVCVAHRRQLSYLWQALHCRWCGKSFIVAKATLI